MTDVPEDPEPLICCLVWREGGGGEEEVQLHPAVLRAGRQLAGGGNRRGPGRPLQDNIQG